MSGDPASTTLDHLRASKDALGTPAELSRLDLFALDITLIKVRRESLKFNYDVNRKRRSHDRYEANQVGVAVRLPGNVTLR
jgi:hypothetical protein